MKKFKINEMFIASVGFALTVVLLIAIETSKKAKPNDFSGVYQIYMKAVNAKGAQIRHGLGTGFKINENASNRLMTAKHVCHAIRSNDNFVVVNEQEIEVTKVHLHMQTEMDVCIIELEQGVPGKVYPLASLRLGDKLRGVGYPGSQNRKLEVKAIVAVQERFSQAFAMMSIVLLVDRQLVATGETVVPGMSGGPVLNVDGDLVGVISAYEPSTGNSIFVPLIKKDLDLFFYR